MKKNKKCTKMTREIFQEFLIMTMREIAQGKGIVLKNYLFKIKPNYEWDKGPDGETDVMRYVIFKSLDLNRKYTIDEVTRFLGWKIPRLPLWVKVSYLNNEEGYDVFLLESASRMRSPSLLHNQETGHPPFKAILE